MEFTASQILTIVGLGFEFSSVAYTMRKVFPTKSKKERKNKWIEEHGETLDQKVERIARESFKTLGLLSIGVILQGIAGLV